MWKTSRNRTKRNKEANRLRVQILGVRATVQVR